MSPGMMVFPATSIRWAAAGILTEAPTASMRPSLRTSRVAFSITALPVPSMIRAWTKAFSCAVAIAANISNATARLCLRVCITQQFYSYAWVNATQAKRGESFRERHLAFESWDALARVLTGKRMELLRYVRRHNVASVRALAKALERDYSNVHADVQALMAAGLLDTTRGGVRADYDAIETKIAI